MKAALASKMRENLSAPKEYIVINLAVRWKICLLAAMHRIYTEFIQNLHRIYTEFIHNLCRIYTRYFKLSSNSVQWIKTNLGRFDPEEDGRPSAPTKRPLPVYIPEGWSLHHCRCTIVIRISPICVYVKTLCLLVQHRTGYRIRPITRRLQAFRDACK